MTHGDCLQLNQDYPYFEDLSRALKGVYSPWRLVCLFAAVSTIFALIVNSSWKATPDSALYLELGESLASGNGYVYNGSPHTYVPPGFPLILSVWIGSFGVDFFHYRLLMALIGVVTAFLGLGLIWRLCGADTGLVIGGLFAINHTIVLNSTYTSSDIPFTLFVLFSLHLVLTAQRSPGSYVALVIAGVGAGLPALIRVNGWGLAPALAVFLWRSSDADRNSTKLFRISIFLFFAFIGPLAWEYIKSGFPVSGNEGEYLRAVSGRSFDTQVSVILGSAWEYLFELAQAITGISMRIVVVELLILFLVAIGLITAITSGERLFSILTIIQMCGLLLSSAGSRYLAPLIPGFYLFLGMGCLRLASMIRGTFPRFSFSESRIIGALFLTLALTNLGANVQTIYQSRTALQPNGGESLKDASFFTAADWIKRNAGQGPVLSMNPRIIRYLTGVRTVDVLRSGVPEHIAWASTEKEISGIIQEHHPRYLFADSKNEDLRNVIFETIRKHGGKLIEVKEARSGDRFSLWEIVMP